MVLAVVITPNSFPTQRQFSSILTANYHTINAKYHYSMKVHCLKDNNQTFYKFLYTLLYKLPSKGKNFVTMYTEGPPLARIWDMKKTAL